MIKDINENQGLRKIHERIVMYESKLYLSEYN